MYTYPNNFRANKALVAAQYSGHKVNVHSDFVFGETNKTEEFLKKFPLGKVCSTMLTVQTLLSNVDMLKVPAFETADGQYIAESNAIAYFGIKEINDNS